MYWVFQHFTLASLGTGKKTLTNKSQITGRAAFKTLNGYIIFHTAELITYSLYEENNSGKRKMERIFTIYLVIDTLYCTGHGIYV